MKLVIDASVAVAASATAVGFARFDGIELLAPPLLWIEVVSALHAAMWRGELRRDQAELMRQRALNAPITRMEPDALLTEPWAVADELGMLEYPIARAFADARITRIYGGTTEIMKEIIGRSLGV